MDVQIIQDSVSAEREHVLVLVVKGGYNYYQTWLCISWRSYFDLELVLE